MNCEQVRTLLEGEQDSSVGAEQREACAEHLNVCAECAAYAARLPAENDALTGLIRQADDEASWARVKSRVAERMAPAGTRKRGPFTRRTGRFAPNTGWIFAAAALVAVVLIGGLLYSHLKHDGSSEKSGIVEAPQPAPAPAPKPERDSAQVPQQAPKLAEQQPPESTPPAPAPDLAAPQNPSVADAPPSKDGAAQSNPPAAVAHADPQAIKSPGDSPVRKSGPAQGQGQGQVLAAATARLSQFQRNMREDNILDDVEQLSIALNKYGEPDDNGLMEDAGLHLERVLFLEHGDLADARPELTAINEVAGEFREVENAVKKAPQQFRASLKHVIVALDEAGLGASLPNTAGRVASGEAAEGEAAQLWTSAEMHLHNTEYANAAAGYRTLAERFPNSRHAGPARFTAAFLLQTKLGKTDDARAMFEQLAAEPGHNQLAAHAQYHFADSCERAGELAKALTAYHKLKGMHIGVNVAEKIAFLDAQLNGRKPSKPGWADGVPKGELLMNARPDKHNKKTHGAVGK